MAKRKYFRVRRYKVYDLENQCGRTGGWELLDLMGEVIRKGWRDEVIKWAKKHLGIDKRKIKIIEYGSKAERLEMTKTESGSQETY